MKILLTILLVIGKVLLVLLAILLALLLLLLLVPFRYRVDAKKEGAAMQAMARLSYLFHAFEVRLTIQKAEGGSLRRDADILLFGISRAERARKKQEKERQKRKSQKQKHLEQLKAEHPEEYEALRKEALSRKQKKSAKEEAPKETPQSAAPPNAQNPVREPVKEKPPAQNVVKMPKPAKAKKRTPLISLFGKLTEQTYRIVTAVMLLPIRLISKIYQTLDRIKERCAAIKEVLDFLRDPRFWAALKLLKKDLKKVWQHVRPRKLTGQIDYGCSNPALTGQVLGAASLLYPLYGSELSLNPDFDAEKTLVEGHLHLVGRIRLGRLLWLAATLLLNQNTRYVIAYVRGRGDKEEEHDGN